MGTPRIVPRTPDRFTVSGVFPYARVARGVATTLGGVSFRVIGGGITVGTILIFLSVDGEGMHPRPELRTSLDRIFDDVHGGAHGGGILQHQVGDPTDGMPIPGAVTTSDHHDVRGTTLHLGSTEGNGETTQGAISILA